MSVDVREFEKKCQMELEKLRNEEVTLTQDLENMFDQKVFLEDKMRSLSKLIPTLKIIKAEANDLVNTVNDISESSEKISSKIRSLDVARSRVDECQRRVSDLIDLDLCSKGVQAAILDSDYERGAAHVHRYLSIDLSLLQKTADDMGDATDLIRSMRTLRDSAGQLRAIVEHKFSEAVETEDLSSIERFFKIFPLLGMYDEGIREFCTYLRTKVAAAAEKNLKIAIGTSPSDKRYAVIFADTLTLLFEGLARVIDTHQPLIETYYGPGRLLSAVLVLQKECDIQTKRILLEWSKSRQIQKKTQIIEEVYRMPASGSFSKLERLEVKEVDVLVGEMVLMYFRSELYVRFIRKKILTDIDVGVPDQKERDRLTKLLNSVLDNSDFTRSRHELLTHYLNFERYYIEESVSKAVSIETQDNSQTSSANNSHLANFFNPGNFQTQDNSIGNSFATSSLVDDSFFIAKKCIRRGVSTGSLDGVCVIINNVCATLERSFCEVLRVKLRQGYPTGYLDLSQAYSVLQNSLQQGKLGTSTGGDAEAGRAAFIVALNNADASLDYVSALRSHVVSEIEDNLPDLTVTERAKFESCLSGLSSVEVTLKDIVEYGIQQLRTTVIKPRINPWVDAFLNFNHQLSEEELSTYEAGESFVQTLIMNLETLLSSFKDVLTLSNYDNFMRILTIEVTQRLEKVILKTNFNRLGGLVLDKEVRTLAGYVTAMTSWSVREKFARLTQIATILNLEQLNEIYDYWGSHEGALTWRLTPAELRSVMALRTDFRIEEIRKLKL